MIMIKKLFITSLLFITGFLFAYGAEAVIAPQIYFTNISLQEKSFDEGQTIKGTVSLWNYEEYVMGDLSFRYELSLVEGIDENRMTQVIDQKDGVAPFTLLAGEKKNQKISYSLPYNLPEGNFLLTVQLVNGKGEKMNWTEKEIDIRTKGRFLILDNQWIIKDGENQAVGGGVNYEPGERPRVTFDVENKSSVTISSYFKIITYKRNVGGEILNEKEGEKTTLKAGEKITKTVSIPKMTKADSYLTEISFYETKNDALVSNPIYFRWIVVGENDAEILFIKLSKESYIKGDIAKIEVDIAAPAGTEIFTAGKGTLEVTLYNNKDEAVGQKSIEVELDGGKEIVKVLIEKDVDNPRIEAKIIKGGEVIDSYGLTLNAEIEREPVVDMNGEFIILIILTFILFVAVIGLVIFLIKK